MENTFKILLNRLRAVCNKYDPESEKQKLELFKIVRNKKLPAGKLLVDFQNILLFIIAHPSNKNILIEAEEQLMRICTVLKNTDKSALLKLQNTGLPFTVTNSTFSHDLLKWYTSNSLVSISLDSFNNDSVSLNNALQFTLPSLEKEITTFNYKKNKLFAALKVEKKDTLSFLLSEFDRLNEQPYMKDYLFNGLQLYVNLFSESKGFSFAYNRMQIGDPFYHKEIIKKFDQVELLNRKLPEQKKINSEELSSLVGVIKNSLSLLQRETDPVTYIDERSFKLYELERGVSIAIYGMTIERQLPLESYVGYTLFKNGLPSAYGGGWVFGKRSLFGINIFESYRGGESGYLMCQLLRVYRQVFGVDYFEIEPYQYGAGNPEGIRSGAYWFYFRFGFRSLNKELNQISLQDFEKIQKQKGYRSSEKILKRFTESNIALNMGMDTPITLAEIRGKLTSLIAKEFQGNRMKAEKQIRNKFIQKAGKVKPFKKEEKKTLNEMAFLCEAMNISAAAKVKLMVKAIIAKSSDLYEYQKLLIKLLE